MAEKSIIIIGAGVAGLSTGCYTQMNGYRAKIFEMHAVPGGVCTSWKRDGYKIDGCLHWVTGIKAGTVFYPIWEELGVIQKLAMIKHDEYARIEGKGGKVFVVYSDIDRLEHHMKEIAPEDNKLIEEFTNDIRKLIGFPVPWEKPSDLFTPLDIARLMMRMTPYASVFRKWRKKTIGDVARWFKNPFMRNAFNLIFNLENSPDFPILAVMTTFAWMHQKTLGYPVGGSLKFALTIKERYQALGGELHYNSRVDKILVEKDRAVGVQLTDGSEHRADYVISAADGRTTIFDMLEGKYTNRKIRGYYKNMELFPPLIYVGLGVADSFENIPSTVTGINILLDEPVAIGEKERDHLSVQFYTFDPTLAPKGKTFVRVHFPSDYDYWKKLGQDPKRYEAEKEKIAKIVIHLLDRRFPGFATQVEMHDVATPLTWVRYTGNWRGSFEGWIETTKTLTMRMSQRLPGLKNFYMAGQWVQPGGSVPAVAMSGRNVTQIICKMDKKPFTTTVP